MDYRLITSPNGEQEKSIIETILTNRGIPLKEVEHYLNTTDDDILDPLLLENMREGVMLLTRHISEGHKIAVRVDELVSTLNSLNCGNPLRASITKFIWRHNEWRLVTETVW